MSMDKDRNTVVEWIRRDPEHYRYLLSFYDTGAAVVQADEDALVLVKDTHRLAYGAGVNIKADSRYLLMCDSRAETERLLDSGLYVPEVLSVWMEYYPEKTIEREEIPGIRFRKLTMDDYDFVSENYQAPAGKLKGIIELCIKTGMIGAEDENGLCGFIGLHPEGTMGFLHILPSHRRRGIGEALEKELIHDLLERREYPYCHVVENNTPSLKLQEKIGMKRWPDLFCWIAGKDFAG